MIEKLKVISYKYLAKACYSEKEKTVHLYGKCPCCQKNHKYLKTFQDIQNHLYVVCPNSNQKICLIYN